MSLFPENSVAWRWNPLWTFGYADLYTRREPDAPNLFGARYIGKNQPGSLHSRSVGCTLLSVGLVVKIEPPEEIGSQEKLQVAFTSQGGKTS